MGKVSAPDVLVSGSVAKLATHSVSAASGRMGALLSLRTTSSPSVIRDDYVAFEAMPSLLSHNSRLVALPDESVEPPVTLAQSSRHVTWALPCGLSVG